MSVSCEISGTLLLPNGQPNTGGAILVRAIHSADGELLSTQPVSVLPDAAGDVFFSLPANTIITAQVRYGAERWSKIHHLKIPDSAEAKWNDLCAVVEWPASETLQMVRESQEQITTLQESIAPSNTDNVAEGATNLYFTVARVLSATLDGISFVAATVVTAADSLLVALGKLQAQISAHSNTLASHTADISSLQTTVTGHTASINSNTIAITTNAATMSAHIANVSNPHVVTKAQIGLGNVNNLALIQQTLPAYSPSALPSYVSDPEASAYTAPALIINAAKLADLNALRAAYENLRVDYEATRAKVIASGLAI